MRSVRAVAAVAALGAALLPGAGKARAQEGAFSSLMAGVEKDLLSVDELFRTGGSLMYVLVGLSVVALAFVIYFLFVLRREAVAPRTLQRELIRHLRSGELAAARAACQDRPGPLAFIAVAALDHIEAVSRVEPALLRDTVEGEGTRQAAAIREPTQYLLDIAVIAPMVGLLGTVFGMLGAFSSIASDVAGARPIVLAGHVSKALVTTAGGLIVGIPSMAFYAFFRGRAARLTGSLERAAAEIMGALLARKPE